MDMDFQNSKRGRFIALEGLDGSGKSTQAGRLQAFLEEKGFCCSLDCEPTDRPTGRLIREILKGEQTADARTLALLFAADRLEHVTGENGISARLERGEHVISDRYYFSSYAYQMADMPFCWVRTLNEPSAALCRPDLHIFIDTDPTDCLSRIYQNRDRTDLFENRSRLVKTRENFLWVINELRQQERVCVIDGNADSDTVFKRLCAAIEPLF